MAKFRQFFKVLGVKDWIFLGIFIPAIVICAIVFGSDPFVTLTSIFGMFSVVYLTKGNIAGTVMQVVQILLYVVVCAFNSYWGEIIVNALVSLPLAVISFFTWIKNYNNAQSEVKVEKIGLLEWLVSAAVMIVLGVGLYFLLGALGTNNLLLSTVAAIFAIWGSYLRLRRSAHNFTVYLVNGALVFAMWLWVVIENGDLSYITLLVEYVGFLVLDIIGLVNWLKLQKKTERENELL